MISLLERIFIKDRTDGAKTRTLYGILCGVLGIFLNLLLFSGKFFAGIVSGSISITADAFNNLSDAMSSIVTLLGFKLSAMKPDSEHPWGHGRYEYISGLIVSMLIVLMGFELAKGSFEKILSPAPVELDALIIVILCVSVAIKLYMAIYNRGIGRKIDSAALKATSTDSLSDAIATSVVLAAAIIGRLTNLNIDGWCGMIVSGMVIIAGIKAARETISPLLGTPPSPELVKDISDSVMKYPEICGIHDLMVHNYGPGRLIISLHAEVSDKRDMIETHDIIDNAERELNEKFKCVSIIHMDPIASDDENVIKLKEAMTDIVKKIDGKITIHDFRVVNGPTHTNLIFDAIIPYDCKLNQSEIHELINAGVSELPGNYYAVVRLEDAFSEYPQE